MFKKILLCSDGSDHALHATRAAAEIAEKFGAQLVSLSVYDPSSLVAAYIGVPGGSLETTTDSACYANETLDAVEKETSKILTEHPIHYEARREFGHPVERIIAVAEDEKVDLIVLGSRGLGGFERFLLGSVSEGVLRHAHCPVLILR
jgi:nucleotide-binding universal stress UspA family protein